MEKIIKQIEKLLTVTDEEVKKRKIFFFSQSIDWQIGEEGTDHTEITERFCTFQKVLNEWNEELTLSIDK